jgi:FMN reductase (NADPH)
MNDVWSCMANHRSVREFAPEAVEDELVHGAVRAAQRAATSSDVQAYSLVRVREASRREKLAELSGGQAQVREAGVFLVVAGDARRHALVAEREGRAYCANLETFLVAVIDAALFAQNLALAFEAQGLGICFIGGLRNELAEVDRLLELPRFVFPLFGMCVGVARDIGAFEVAQRPRLPLEAVLHEERYLGDAELLGVVERHDVAMREYYAARGAEGRNWSGGVSRKFEREMRGELRCYCEGKGARFG